MNDVVFLSLENWDDIWRRNQFVCAELSRRNPGMKILFVALPRDVSNAVRRGKIGKLFRDSCYAAPGFGNITIVHPDKLLPNSIAVGRRWNEGAYRRAIAAEVRRKGLGPFVLWVNAHWAGHCVGKLGEVGSVYDVTDDWTSLTQSVRLRELIESQDRALCRKADATIVCSERLREMKRGMAGDLHLIPNWRSGARGRILYLWGRFF